jgi:hypothetical protein
VDLEMGQYKFIICYTLLSLSRLSPKVMHDPPPLRTTSATVNVPLTRPNLFNMNTTTTIYDSYRARNEGHVRRLLRAGSH